MRVVLDTNVLVCAFAARGTDLLELVLLDHDLIVGRNVLREVDRALRQKIRLPANRAFEVVGFVAGEATQFVEGALPADARVERADALVLGEAGAGQAEIFVTADAALPELGLVDGLRIGSPRQFWETLHAGG